MITNRSPDLSYFVSEKLTDLDLSHNNDLREVTLVHHAINIIKGSSRDPVQKETINNQVMMQTLLKTAEEKNKHH